MPSAKTSRGPLFFVQRLADVLGRAETVFRQRRVPGENRVLGDEHVGVAVAVEVHEAQVGLIPGDIGQ